MTKCIKKCKREGDICIGCLRTMDEIRRAGMSKNDVTGDNIVTKKPSKAYDEGYDRIFKAKPKQLELPLEEPKQLKSIKEANDK